MLRDESVQTLIALASLTIIVLFLLTFYPTNVTDFVSFLSKSRHTVYGLHENHYHGIIGNATTNINGSNVTDIRSNNTTARSAMNMNSSSMSSMLERGNIAMGFNQNKIMHHFIATPTGGAIMIVALNSSDNDTIKQIRNHVLDIQNEFSQGNFTKPFFIHAQQVPGTKLMTEKKDLIRYSIRQINNGSVLLLTTDDQQLIAAIHQFIAFQTAQHSGH